MTELLAVLRLVDDLRNALTETMNRNDNPAGTPGAKVDLSRLDAPTPAAVRVAHADLPPPFDSMEEAQRAAGIWPATIRMPHDAGPKPTHAVCISEHIGMLGTLIPVGRVVELNDAQHPNGIKNMTTPECWAPCDKDGWVSQDPIFGIRRESKFGPEGVKVWRPLSPGELPRHSGATPKPSALDEMAERMAQWAAPTRECAVPGYTGPFRYEETAPTREVPLEAMFKPTNPKDAAATGRVPLGLLSPIAKAHWALAQHCGRAKYGAWNWREAGARASIYIDAIGRHTDGYLSGETYDPADGTHHLGNIMACCAILLEAEAARKLVDDRPPHLDMRPTYADVEKRQADLTAKYADRNPKHWTR